MRVIDVFELQVTNTSMERNGDLYSFCNSKEIYLKQTVFSDGTEAFEWGQVNRRVSLTGLKCVKIFVLNSITAQNTG